MTGILDVWLYFCYTETMKTAISLPDSLYTEAERTAKRLGIPRSQLYAKALEEFIQRHDRQMVSERLNKTYAQSHGDEFDAISRAGLESMRKLTHDDTW
jgi:metal-responsive CopG/Arc/MetJ family transcriptional regulator